MTLAQLTEPKLLVPRLLSNRQAGAIQELTRRLETTGRIANAPAFCDAVLRREAELPTIVGDVLAVPHARGQAARVLSLAVGLSAAGIPWGPDPRVTVQVLVLFAVPLAESQRYLDALAALSRFVADASAFQEFQRCTQPEAMLRMLDAVSLAELAHPLDEPNRS